MNNKRKIWNSIKSDCENVLNSKKISMERWMSNYSKLYIYCTQLEDSIQAYASINNALYLNMEALLYLHVGKIYDKLTNALHGCNASKEDNYYNFLMVYEEEWQMYSRKILILNGLFASVNQIIVDLGIVLYKMDELGKVEWNRAIFTSLKNDLMEAFLHTARQLHFSYTSENIESMIMLHSILVNVDAEFDTMCLKTCLMEALADYYKQVSNEKKANVESAAAYNKWAYEIRHAHIEFVDFMFNYVNYWCVQAETLWWKKIVEDHAEYMRTDYFYLLCHNDDDCSCNAAGCNDDNNEEDDNNVLKQINIVYYLLSGANMRGLIYGEVARSILHCFQCNVQHLNSGRDDFAANAADGQTQNANSIYKNAQDVVELITRMHSRYLQILISALNNHETFKIEFECAFTTIVNKNIPNYAEMLAKHVDRFLRDNASNTGDMSIASAAAADNHLCALQDVRSVALNLLKYVKSKDVFQSIYGKLLAQRLLNSKLNIDDEQFIVNKLKMQHGLDFVTDFQQLLKDYQTSQDMTNSFLIGSANIRDSRTQLCGSSSSSINDDDNDHDYNIANTNISNDKKTIESTKFKAIKVFAEKAWPYKRQLSQPSVTMMMCPVLQEDVKLFEHYYTGMHSNRKLTWLHSLAKVDLAANYANGGQKTCLFQTSLWQALLLLLFNKDNLQTLTLQQCVDLLYEKSNNNNDNVDKKAAAEAAAAAGETNKGKCAFLLQIAQTLAQHGVLHVHTEGSDNCDGKATANTRLMLNMDYKCAKVKVNLLQPSKNANNNNRNNNYTCEGESLDYLRSDCSNNNNNNCIAFASTTNVASVAEMAESLQKKRKIQIQSALVRIMKSRKVCEFHALVTETITLLKAMFEPDVSAIKTEIDILIEKEYFKRDDLNVNKFIYNS